MVTKTVYEYPPKEILIHPCHKIDAGDTVKTLAKGYVHNTICLDKYKDVVEGIERWKLEREQRQSTND